jgi:hypothetical protein
MEQLIDVLELLAADADQQIASLPDFVVVTDELALLFSDAVLVARSGPHLMSTSTWTAVEDLSAMLERMSAVPALWSDDALRGAPEWSRVRSDARSILAERGQPPVPSRLIGLHYVPGSRDRA